MKKERALKNVFTLATILSVCVGLIVCSLAYFLKFNLTSDSGIFTLFLGHKLHYNFYESFSTVEIIFMACFLIVYILLNIFMSNKSKGYFLFNFIYIIFAALSIGVAVLLNSFFSMTFYYLILFYVFAVLTVVFIFLVASIVRKINSKHKNNDKKINKQNLDKSTETQKVKIDETNHEKNDSAKDLEKSEEQKIDKEFATVLKRSFKAKLILANDDLKKLYNDMLNMIDNYKNVKIRHAFSKDTIYTGRTTIATIKMTTKSKKMYIYFALDKNTYLNSKYHLKDFSASKSYIKTPLRLDVMSKRSIVYALDLLEKVIEEMNCEKNNNKKNIDYMKDLTIIDEEEMINQGLIKKQTIDKKMFNKINAKR